MKITKFDHAFLLVEESSQQLVIDPGSYSPELPKLENVVGIVLTHLHDDHSYLPHIKAIQSQFPQVKIYGPQDVAAKLGEISCEVVSHGSHLKVGSFQLDFFGECRDSKARDTQRKRFGYTALPVTGSKRSETASVFSSARVKSIA